MPRQYPIVLENLSQDLLSIVGPYFPPCLKNGLKNLSVNLLFCWQVAEARVFFLFYVSKNHQKDAIKDLDGSSLCGERVRLELANVSRAFHFFLKVSAFSDPEAPADQVREIEAVAIEEMIAADLTALIEHDTLSKSRTCQAESGTVF